MQFRGIVYRAHNPRWAWAPLSGEGAMRHGGRFNSRGMNALYTSLRLETAWLEAQQAFPFKAQPMTICAYEVECDDVLDLTDGTTLAEQSVSPAALACSWEDFASRGLTPPSWDVARTLYEGGAAGVVVPSFAAGAGPTDRNLVLWRWSANRPHRVAVIDPDGRLPRDGRSWT